MTNYFSFVGRLASDVDFTTTSSGKSRATFRIAVSNAGDQKREEGVGYQAGFFQIDAWDKTAEFVNQHFTKGKPIAVSGTIRHSVWEQEGQRKSRTRFIANSVNFLPSDSTKGDLETAEVGAAEEAEDSFFG